VKTDYGVWIMPKLVILIVPVDDMLLFGAVMGKKILKRNLEEVFIMKWMPLWHRIR